MLSRAVLFLLVVCLPSPLLGVQEEAKLDRWIRVPFSGTITLRQTRNGTSQMGEMEVRVDEHSGLQAHVTGCKKMFNDYGDFEGWYPEGSWQASYALSSTTTTKSKEPVTIVHEGEGSGSSSYSYGSTSSFWVDLQVNPGKGLYRLRLPKGWAEGVLKTTMIIGDQHLEGADKQKWEIGGLLEDGYLSVKDEPYSPKSGIIAGSETYNALNAREGLPGMAAQAMKQTGYFAGSPPILTANWNLFLNDPEGRMDLEPDDTYSDWIPHAPGDPEVQESLISITARIVEPEDAKGIIEFKLEDVSREPGICLNWPRNDDDRGMDLDIAIDLNNDLKISFDSKSAKTFEPVREATLWVKAKDYGAYGKISATAKLVTGKGEVEIRGFYRKLGTPYATLPDDEDDNSIADAWQRTHNVQGDGSDDEDNQPEGATKGDGLSLYEEYRGFYIQGRHERLDPQVKDLFVYDRDGLLADSCFERAASPLRVHYVTEGEMNGAPHMTNYRIVNPNHDRYHIVDQHGLVVISDPEVSDNWGLCHGPGEPGPPVTANPHISVYVNTIRRALTNRYTNHKEEIDQKLGGAPPPAWLENHIKGAISMVAAHECGHGIGIFHHLKTLPPGPNRENVSPSAGWMMCVMRYQVDYSDPDVANPYPLPVEYHDDVLDILKGIWPWPNTFCTTMDNCKSQIKISDAER
ncbi:MAG: hypothetical protein WAO20_20940 [Acidobacteriota bacterium]